MIKHIARALALLVALVGLATFTQPAQAFYDRDCGDFATQAAAQTFFNNAGPGDPHRLDADGNGIACESNPCPCIGRGNPQPNPGNTGGNNTPNPGPALYRETGNVVKVIDGDTLKVRLKSGALVSVRMLGINTPERGRCGANDATDNLRKLAPVRSTVDMVSDRSQAAKDRYGRLLRYVAKRGGYKDLSYRQAFNGYTKRYVFGGKPVARDGQYVRAITQARNNDRGLWNSCW
ncbi:hypothetical protein EXE59_18975 [Nocardioides eburneiflavus]|uniref:TNase-like domain-containing protein n=1 Tax=Nocardioides eburneiflavus TaxID=2518372 RepID=A0A4Z1CGX8_9ACTN|nr:excalibur calcium-binding domain-containing protein [Nocardioides eburneiflavus]TGN65805.1 hypothetical protein EXE59_18975 [Nocardioides eburneiflavus]